jgi:hypothetical protein
LEIWKYNLEFHKNENVTIKNRKNLKYLLDLGHKETDTVSDVCKYYIHLLSEIKYYNTKQQ